MRPISLILAVSFALVLGGGRALADPVSLTGTVIPEDGLYRYHYQLRNTTDTELTQRVTEFLLPLFRLEDVEPGSVVSAAGWSHEFLTGADLAGSSWLEYLESLFGSAYLPHSYIHPPVVLRWLAEGEGGLLPDAIGEFSFLSQYTETNTPYVATLADPTYFHVGDPPIPYNGNVLVNNPEPMSLVVFGAVGLVGLGLFRRRGSRGLRLTTLGGNSNW